MNHSGCDIVGELMGYMQGHQVISTHSHHLPDDAFKDFTLDTLLKRSYVDWCGVQFDGTKASRSAYLHKVGFKSYFVWLQISLKELYGFQEPLSADNWDGISGLIRSFHQDASFHLRVLKDNCRYTKIILDTYWDPGSDNGHADLFCPTFRVDPLFFAYAKDAKDHDGNNPSAMYGQYPDNLADFLLWVRQLVIQKKQQGCIALKCALAYDRGLDFKSVKMEKANKVFRLGTDEITTADIANFQNYLFNYLCGLAAEFSLPFQCHTGLGQLSGTRAMAMKEVIEGNPQTKFVLFHCSYPWTSDISALLHSCQNVYPDLCWLPLISPTAAQRTLHELIEVGTSDKICWGCDTWTSEESFGALLAFRSVLAHVLKDKIEAGYFSVSDAKLVIDNLMVNNAAALYDFPE